MAVFANVTQGARSLIKSVQHITAGPTYSANVTISAVDMSKTMVVSGGSYGIGGAGASGSGRFRLTTSTNVIFEGDGLSNTSSKLQASGSATIVEFW